MTSKQQITAKRKLAGQRIASDETTILSANAKNKPLRSNKSRFFSQKAGLLRSRFVVTKSARIQSLVRPSELEFV